FITLARELGSISEADVVRLSELLGMDCIGKEFVEKRFEEIGMPTDSLREYDEKRPGFFARLFRGEPDHYLDTLRNILYFEVQKDNKLIVGRGANFLFACIPNCLRVKLVASKEIRLKNIMEWEGCTMPVAQAMMDKSDRDRAGFCLFHYNEDWYAANSYDVVVKTDTLTLETLAPFLLCAMKSIMTRERDEQGQKLLDDKMLVNRIVFRLREQECLPLRFLVVESNNGKVVLNGLAMSEIVSQRAAEVAASVDGVVSVLNQLKIMTHPLPRRVV
ncbi:MAG: cytidylate kinase family protein, partial [Victivallales bacterium]|nr:cytidylate kinase family protein [Victivallales bacterium]